MYWFGIVTCDKGVSSDYYPILISKLLPILHFTGSFGELSYCFPNALKTVLIFRFMTKPRLLLSVIVFTSAVSLLHADEPLVDDNANLDWWVNSISADPLDGSFDLGDAGPEGEVWWRRWGLKASYFKSDVDDTSSEEGMTLLSVDFKRRFVSATRNSFISLGLGWENVALDDVDEEHETQGLRLSLEGRLGVTPLLHLYGHGAWLPSLRETERVQDPRGLELEAGLSVEPIPHLSFRAGYREFRLDFKSLQGANESSKSQGVVFGAGVHW